jgi:hypothetical protein
MIYAKVDVELRDHPRAQQAGEAMATWLWALLYTRRHELDGFVPDSALRGAWVSEEVARAHARVLADCGLFSPADGGWHIVRYAEKNESRADIEARREFERKRKQDQRKRRSPSRDPDQSQSHSQSQSQSQSQDNTRDSHRSSHPVSHALSHPLSQRDSAPAAASSVRRIDKAPIVEIGTAGSAEAAIAFVDALASAGAPRGPVRDRAEFQAIVDAINANLRADGTVLGAIAAMRTKVVAWVDPERAPYASGWSGQAFAKWARAGFPAVARKPAFTKPPPPPPPKELQPPAMPKDRRTPEQRAAFAQRFSTGVGGAG